MPERKIKLKVCGMRDPENILKVAQLQPDYLGFIFYQKSKRFVGEGFSMPVGFPRGIRKVGVFVNASREEILQKAEAFALEAVQLHGNAPGELCRSLKDDGLEVIKTFQLDNHFDFHRLNEFRENVDYFLFDTKSDQYGGSGRAFDWNVLSGYDQSAPFFLSGGISAANATAIGQLRLANLYAVDINSGVEISPALKDPDMIKMVRAILNSIV